MWGPEMGLNAVDNLPSFVLEGHSRHCPCIAMICQRVSGVYKCLAGLIGSICICICTYLRL